MPNSNETKTVSRRGGARPGAGRKKRAPEEVAAAVNSGKVSYVRADTAIGVRRAFVQLLEEQGCDDLQLAKRIAEGVSAQETVFAKFEGKITDSKDVVAWSERRQYVELACRIKQLVPKDANDGREIPNIQVNIIHIGGGQA